MGWNEPDDWNCHYHICSACGGRYHLSGSDVCDCEPCEKCDESVPPNNLTYFESVNESYCEDCVIDMTWCMCDKVMLEESEMYIEKDWYCTYKYVTYPYCKKCEAKRLEEEK